MKVLSGLDLNGNQITNVDTIIDGTENDIVKIGSNGELVDSGVSVNDLQPNVIESISVNNTTVTPVNKNVNIDLSGYVASNDERLVPTVTMNLAYDFNLIEQFVGNRISNPTYSFANNETPDVPFAKVVINITCNIKQDNVTVMTSETTQCGWLNQREVEFTTTGGQQQVMNIIHITAPLIYGDAVANCEAIIGYDEIIIFEPVHWLTEFAQTLSPVAASGSYNDLQNKPSLSAVATSGDYDDLSNKPDMSGYAETANLATVATSGSYNDLSNKPNVEDFVTMEDIYGLDYVKESDLSPVATSGDYDDLLNRPDLSPFALSEDLATVATSGDYDDLLNKPELANVATSGSYNDLSDTPDLSEYISETDIYGMGIAFLSGLASVATSGDYGDLSNTPDLSDYVMSSDLASVATSGDYGDLSNTPELATVATSGSYEDLFDTPDLSDYVLSENLSAVATSGSYNDLEDRPNLTAVAAFFSLNILNEDNTDSFTFDATYISSDATPIVQTVYENKIVTDGIEVSFDPSTGSITVQWDDTKYDVNSNTPLTVSIVGAPIEREES